MDATCTPADIRYPTDLSLLNEAREKTEQIVDCFHRHLVETTGKARKKPRTYRRKARRDYLEVAKQKSPTGKKLRKATGKQLRYLKRNLGHIKTMIENNGTLLTALTGYEYKCLLVIHTLYAQQLQMYSARTHRIEDRIVSISQPHVRPRKPTAENRSELYAAREQRHQDELDRIPIEGKFGNSKRRGTLGRIMAKLSDTSESVIHVGLVVLNLQTWLRKTLICLHGKALQTLESVFEELACYFDDRKCCNYDRRRVSSPQFIAAA